MTRIDWSKEALPDCPDCKGTGEVDDPVIAAGSLRTKTLCHCIPSRVFLRIQEKFDQERKRHAG